MKLRYHLQTFELINISPAVSQKNLEQIAKLERDNKLKLPLSIKEWYGITDHQRILQELINRTLNHSVLSLEEGFSICHTLDWLPSDNQFFYTLEENQCVYHVAVKLENIEDPPVYFRYYEPNEQWHIHAKTFSDWIYAIAWDSMNWNKFITINSPSDLSALLAESTEVGPETYGMNMWLRASTFRRVLHNGERKIVIVQ